MIIRMDTDQIKKIRDDAFECAAKLAETSKGYPTELSERIRAMKDSPVNVLAKGKS